MADYTSDRTGASIDTVLDNADAGNIGKTYLPTESTDLNNITASGFVRTGSGAANNPAGSDGTCLTLSGTVGGNVQSQTFISATAGDSYFRSKYGSWSAWKKLYHTGNTGVVSYGGASPTGTDNDIVIGPTTSTAGIFQGVAATTPRAMNAYYNPNGQVGGITISGTTTSFNTSSDPRLKDFKTAPTDTEVNAKFDDLFGCFKTFNWKNDPTGDLVWGFDAHACIDAGLDMGSEGEGSRDLALGDVYDTTPAELDEDGVEIKAAVEHKVSPAGVDQSKAVPILLAKIEQLERRLKALEV